MILGAFGMDICMLLVGVLLRTTGNPSYDDSTHKVIFSFADNENAGRAMLALLYLYVASFAISWATPAWVIPAEVFSLNTRVRANSLTTATNRLVNLFSALWIPTALNNISWKFYIAFAAICVATGINTGLFQVETANRSLEEMDDIFRPERTMWTFIDREWTTVKPKGYTRAMEELQERGLQRADEVQGKTPLQIKAEDVKEEANTRGRHVEEA